MEKIFVLDGIKFKEMLVSGYKVLERDYKLINDLNVFPVPDGDTGTNMKITYLSGLNSIKEEKDLSEIVKRFARGTLFGARGNSGVLLSQYFKGIANYIENKKEVNVLQFANSLIEGYKTAYKCAINPVEGTILTVAREGIEKVIDRVSKELDFLTFMELVNQSMYISLENTPNHLEILRESGVIDSGGRGLLSIFNGYLNYFKGEEVSELSFEDEEKEVEIDYSLFNENSVLDYGYCTEFLLQLLKSKIDVESFDINKYISDISAFGDSLVVTQTGTIVKVHIHTKDPSKVIKFSQQYGEFLKFKIENMALQHNEVIKHKQAKRKDIAVVTIAFGEGVISTFKELGADVVISGGQTMNTSTNDIISAVKEANANNVILVPNNSNILLACKQAQELYKESNIYIVETKTIQEGYYALSMMIKNDELESILEEMNTGKELVISSFVSKATRDFTLTNTTGKAGQYIGFIADEIKSANDNIVDTAVELIDNIEDIDNKEVMFVFYGKDVEEDVALRIKELINEKYPYLEIGLIDGKQPVYDLLIGVNV